MFTTSPVRLFALAVSFLGSYSYAQTIATPAFGINVQASGVKADGVTNDTPTLQKLIDSNLSGAFYFPPGTYRLHNAGVNTPGLALQGFSGSIVMATGAKFACDTESTQSGQCIWVYGSNGATFQNLTITYTNPSALPMARTSATGNALLVQNSTNISLYNTTVIGSTGSGIWNTDSTGISYNGTTKISNTTADGIHFENVGNSTVANVITNGTGDDAIGVTNIAATNPNCGLTVTSASITTSRSRGIAAVGACNAVFSNIVINGTANSAIASVNDLTISSRTSTNIQFNNIVANGVAAVSSTIGGNGYCVDIGHSTYVTVFNMSCSGSRGDGVFVYDTANNITVQDVVLKYAGDNGFQTSGASDVSFIDDQVTGAANNGYDVEQSSNVTLRNCQTFKAVGYGFYHSGSSNIVESTLTSQDSATTIGNHRAWWAESMSGPISANGLTVVDDRSAALGYIVGDYNLSSNALVVNGIVFQIAHGSGTVQKNDGSASYYMYGQPGVEW